MFELQVIQESEHRPLFEAMVASAGMGLFGLFVHSASPWVLLSAVGFLATNLAVLHSLCVHKPYDPIFELLPLSKKTGAYVVLGFAAGALFGMLFRLYQHAGPLPAGLGRFVLVAAAIGVAEELLFRGYVQGRLKGIGSVPAIVLAAAAHTAYKWALFAWPPEGILIDYQFLAIWTFVGGLVFGGLRELSRSVLPPIAGHAFFDILVYGERVHAPWWVWS
jgi:membrane protease YdiL (CAAX protease family)